MKVLVLGGDGYLGWPTALHLSQVGHDVAVADNFARRGYDHEMGVDSLVPIESLRARIAAWRELTGKTISSYVGDLCDADFTYHIVRDFAPDAIVHYAEQRAAPYSMVDRKHAVYTQVNNVVGNLNVLYAMAEINPDIHLVKLGTMGTRAAGTGCCSPSGRVPSTTCPRCMTATTSSSPAGSGGSARPTSTRAWSTASRPRRRPWTTGSRPGSTTTRCSARC